MPEAPELGEVDRVLAGVRTDGAEGEAMQDHALASLARACSYAWRSAASSGSLAGPPEANATKSAATSTGSVSAVTTRSAGLVDGADRGVQHDERVREALLDPGVQARRDAPGRSRDAQPRVGRSS